MPGMMTDPQPDVDHPNDPLLGHLLAAREGLEQRLAETERGEESRCLDVLRTDLEKVIALEAYYFPRP